MTEDPKAVIDSLSASQQETFAALIQAAKMQGFRAAEQNREQAIAMGYQMALDRVAELDAATRRRSEIRYEDRVAARIAEMEATAKAFHARSGTTRSEWKGLDNGAQLPSADWDDDGDGDG